MMMRGADPVLQEGASLPSGSYTSLLIHAHANANAIIQFLLKPPRTQNSELRTALKVLLPPYYTDLRSGRTNYYIQTLCTLETSPKMSGLQRTFIKPKLPSFPLPHFSEANGEEETDAATDLPDVPLDDDSSSASSASSTGTIIPSSNQKLFARPQG